MCTRKICCYRGMMKWNWEVVSYHVNKPECILNDHDTKMLRAMDRKVKIIRNIR